MTREQPLRLLPWTIAVVAFFIDQLTKLYFRTQFDHYSRVPVIPNFFDLVYVENRGAAGGIMQSHTGLLSIISVVMLILMVVFRKAIFEEAKLQVWAYGLLIGGILGNMYDRIRFGFVTDFLDFYIGSAHWPAFNVADSCICTGVGLYMLSTWQIQRRQERETTLDPSA